MLYTNIIKIGCFFHTTIQSAWERIGHRKLLLRCGVSAALGASAPTEGGEGRGISWRPPAYSLF